MGLQLSTAQLEPGLAMTDFSGQDLAIIFICYIIDTSTATMVHFMFLLTGFSVRMRVAKKTFEKYGEKLNQVKKRTIPPFTQLVQLRERSSKKVKKLFNELFSLIHGYSFFIKLSAFICLNKDVVYFTAFAH